jgi:hypothetical protein
MEFHVVHLTLEIPYYMEKAKEKVDIIAGTEFGAILHGKTKIIDKSLYGSKTFAARFHDNISGSL